MSPHYDLIELQGLDFIRNLANWRQVVPDHARPRAVVVGRELSEQKVEVPTSKDDELRQTFVLDRLNESLAATVEIREQKGVRSLFMSKC